MNIYDIENAQISIFLLFLLISVNYTGNTLNCSLQKIFITSRIAKIIIIFCALFVFVIITNTHYKKKNPIEVLKIALILSFLYIISTKNKPIFVFIFIICSFIVYYIQLYKNFHYEKETKELEKINLSVKDVLFKNTNSLKPKLRKSFTMLRIQYYLNIISILGLCIGFIHYYYLKRIEYRKSWSFWKFILGNNICKGLKNLDVF